MRGFYSENRILSDRITVGFTGSGPIDTIDT